VYQQFLGAANVTIDHCGRKRENDNCPMNDFLRAFSDANPTAMVAYLPHGIHRPAFEMYRRQKNSSRPTTKTRHRDQSDDSKKYNVLLFGSTNERLYPLRAAAQRAVKLSDNVISQFRHPGYAMSWDISYLELCKYYPNHALKQQSDYIQALAQSRICLVGSGAQHVDNCKPIAWTLRKYFEAMAVGCVMIGDVPADLDVAAAVRLRLTGQQPQEIATTSKHFLSEYQEHGSFETWKRAKQDLVFEKYSYESLVTRYFSPAIEEYRLRRLRGVFTATLSPLLVRNDDCVQMDSQAIAINSTRGIRQFADRVD